jgi:hypothetical protein
MTKNTNDVSLGLSLEIFALLEKRFDMSNLLEDNGNAWDIFTALRHVKYATLTSMVHGRPEGFKNLAGLLRECDQETYKTLLNQLEIMEKETIQ